MWNQSNGRSKLPCIDPNWIKCMRTCVRKFPLSKGSQQFSVHHFAGSTPPPPPSKPKRLHTPRKVFSLLKPSSPIMYLPRILLGHKIWSPVSILITVIFSLEGGGVLYRVAKTRSPKGFIISPAELFRFIVFDWVVYLLFFSPSQQASKTPLFKQFP